MSWANRVLPVFMSASAENLRKVLHHVQIDTTHFRSKSRTNPGIQSLERSVNRTAVTQEAKSDRLLERVAFNWFYIQRR